MERPPHPFRHLPREMREHPQVMRAEIDHLSDRVDGIEFRRSRIATALPPVLAGLTWRAMIGIALLVGVITGVIPAEHLPLIKWLLGQ